MHFRQDNIMQRVYTSYVNALTFYILTAAITDSKLSNIFLWVVLRCLTAQCSFMYLLYYLFIIETYTLCFFSFIFLNWNIENDFK